MTVSTGAGRLTAVSIAVIGVVLGGLVAPVATTDAVAQQSQPEMDNTVTRIAVSENGSARWTIQIRTRLDTDQRVEEYAAYQARFRNRTAQYLDPFRTRMQGVVANAENTTDRQMRATNFTASTRIQEVPRRWGVVTYEFTWTNFASQQADGLVVGDIFQGGFFISASDTLQIIAPPDYEITRIDPEPDGQEGNMVTWDGREDFADAHPRVVFAPSPDQNDSSDGSSTPTNSPSTTEDGSVFGTVGLPASLGVIVAVLLGLVAVAAYWRRSGWTGGATADPTETQEEPSDLPPSTTDHETNAADTGSTGAIMTDEERVRTLLEANGGRMRQATIAEEFDWSPSKTSRVVGKMAEDDSVEKLRLGRENLVTLDDE